MATAKRTCSIEGCSREHRALDLCNPHYLFLKRYGDPLYVRPLKNDGPCSLDGCSDQARAHGLCHRHARRMRLYGDPNAPRKKIATKPPQACSVADCETLTLARTMCAKHYERMRRTGTTELYGRRGTCTLEGCLLPHRAHGYCGRHLQRWYKTGDPGPVHSLAGDGSPRRGTDGYVMLTVNRRRMLEHRYVMEQMIGRALLPDENVHHINGLRHDNRPENLELWTTMQPSGQRVVDQVAWAREILRRYA